MDLQGMGSGHMRTCLRALRQSMPGAGRCRQPQQSWCRRATLRAPGQFATGSTGAGAASSPGPDPLLPSVPQQHRMPRQHRIHSQLCSITHQLCCAVPAISIASYWYATTGKRGCMPFQHFHGISRFGLERSKYNHAKAIRAYTQNIWLISTHVCIRVALRARVHAGIQSSP